MSIAEIWTKSGDEVGYIDNTSESWVAYLYAPNGGEDEYLDEEYPADGEIDGSGYWRLARRIEEKDYLVADDFLSPVLDRHHNFREYCQFGDVAG